MPPAAESPSPVSDKKTEIILSNTYGHFEWPSGAFVITDLATPRPWINVLANERYGLVLSQAGGGFSWLDNCQLFRVSRWEQDLVRDEYGRFLYVQDLDQPDELWSTTYQPTRRKAERDQVRHELGCTTFSRRFLNLETKHTVFVPEKETAEVWIVKLRNLASKPRRLRVATYLEWHLGGIGDWHREFHRLFMESRSVGPALLAWKHPGLSEGQREPVGGLTRAFISVHGVDDVVWITDKQAWLGRSGDPARPAGMFEHPAPSSTPRWDDPIAAGCFDLELGRSEEREFVITIGAADSEVEALELSHRFEIEKAAKALQTVRTFWLQRCSAGGVVTQDRATELMVNRWLPYQAIAGRLLAKCAYYQQGGAYGYRDQLQDSLMLLDSDPKATLTQLGRHAEAMYEDGSVRHWWHPDTKIFVESHHSDTCLWLAHGVLAYLDATNDTGALEARYGFLDRKTQELGRSGTLWDHCERGIKRALSKLSPRGLPLIGAGDWNDGLSHAGIDGKGESVWMAMFLFDLLKRWQPFLVQIGKAGLAEQFESAAMGLAKAVEEHGWDGEWYLGGTRDDGKPFGSSQCEEGRVFLNPQTWAVISGIAPPERAKQALDSVRKHLLTPYGALLLAPAYTTVDPYIGYITRYAPGLRENGGVYSHASTWAVLAFAMSGDTETARSIFRGMLPPLRAEQDADLYAAEPYVMPGNLDGPDSPYAGRAGWTWYTGSAAWMRRIAKLLE